MLPQPLHPAIVHFPVVLAVLFPLAVAAGLILISRGARPRAAWLLPLSVAGMLALSSWVAVETGEGEEERVENVVPESAIHEHEEAAELLLFGSGATLLLALVGLAGRGVGTGLRVTTGIASLLLAAAAFQTGRLGGELVYEHGAGSAYVETTGPAPGLGYDD